MKILSQHTGASAVGCSALLGIVVISNLVLAKWPSAFRHLIGNYDTYANPQRYCEETEKRENSSRRWISSSPNIDCSKQKEDHESQEAPDDSSDNFTPCLHAANDKRNHY